MLKEKDIRIIFLLLLFFSIGFYEVSGGVIDYVSTSLEIDLNTFSVIKIGRYLVSALIVFTPFKSKFIIKLIGYKFIGGEYEGKNKELNTRKNITKTTREIFLINQGLLNTSISGISIDENNEFYSMWKGDLIQKKENIYTFLLKVDTSQKKHFGMMDLRIEGDVAVGFTDYFESGKVTYKESLTARRVSQTTNKTLEKFIEITKIKLPAVEKIKLDSDKTNATKS